MLFILNSLPYAAQGVSQSTEMSPYDQPWGRTATPAPTVPPRISSLLPFSSNNLEIQGFLYKQGRLSKQWVRRYFVVMRDCLYCYRPNENLPRSVVFLKGMRSESLPSSSSLSSAGSSSSSGQYHGFRMVFRQKSTVLYAETAESRGEWVSATSRTRRFEQEYTLGQQIGRGGYSTVHECQSNASGQMFAAKKIDRQYLKRLSSQEQQMWNQEVSLLKMLKHPNILHLEDMYEEPETIWIVTKLYVGGPLSDRITLGQPIQESQARDVTRCVLEGMLYIHQVGVVHRDIKPLNLLCSHPSSFRDIVIADLGLSSQIAPGQHLGATCGTTAFAAPEVLTGEGYGKQCDVWSLGVLLFVMLTGEFPFNGRGEQEQMKQIIGSNLSWEKLMQNNISSAAQDLCARMLIKNQRERITPQQALDHPWFGGGGHGRQHDGMSRSGQQNLQQGYGYHTPY